MATVVLPANPNLVLRSQALRCPVVSFTSHSATEALRLAEGHRRWIDAAHPPDALTTDAHQIVGDTIARAIGTLIGGSHWAAIERKLAEAREAADYLDAMQDAVGLSAEHKALASTIAYSLFKWLKPEDLLSGFYEVISPHLIRNGIKDRPAVHRFLLLLAGRPGYTTDWNADDATFILERVLKSPVLYRAARFAVLGTRALNDAEGAERGF